MSKVAQLDSLALDNELYRLISEQTTTSLSKFYKPILAKYNHEIKLVLQSLLFKYTLWDNSNSYGYSLQNLKLVGPQRNKLSRQLKSIYYILFILGDYGLEKLSSRVFSDSDESAIVVLVRKLLVYFNSLVSILKCANFVGFLANGKYSDLRFQALGITSRTSKIELDRMYKGNVNYEFQNRQILWNTVIEFVVFAMPLLVKMRRWSPDWEGLIDSGNQEKHRGQVKSKLFSSLPVSQCAICYDQDHPEKLCPITNPYITNCGHVYSYFCLLEKLEQHSLGVSGAKLVEMSKDEKSLGKFWKCLRCGKPVLWGKPFDDVDEGAILIDDDEEEEEEEKQKEEIEEEKEEIEEGEEERSFGADVFNISDGSAEAGSGHTFEGDSEDYNDFDDRNELDEEEYGSEEEGSEEGDGDEENAESFVL